MRGSVVHKANRGLSDRERFRQYILDHAFVRKSDGKQIIPRHSQGFRDSAWLFDFRAIAFDAPFLKFYATEFWKRYERAYPFQVGGVESASIPFITAIALMGDSRGMPVRSFFMRKSRKRDGLTRMFEGSFTEDPIILVDDILNSGQSFYRQVLALDEAEKRVTDIFVALAFRDTARYGFANERNIRVSSIYMLPDFDIPLLDSVSPEVARTHYETLWHFKPQQASFHFVIEKSAPLLYEGILYFGTDEGYLYALDAKGGATRWQHKIGKHPRGKGIFSSPAASGNSVFFGGYDGNVHALDTKTGEVRWVYADADWIGSSPALASDLGLLYIGMEYGLPLLRGGIVAIDMKTGRRAWGKRSPDYTHGSPLYIERTRLVVVGSNDGVVYAYDAATGSKRWQFATDGALKSSAAYDRERDLVCIASSDGRLYAIRAEDGTLVFSFSTGAPIFSTPLVVGQTLYFSSLDKCLYAIDLETGQERWHFETRGRIFASPVLAMGSLWIGSNDGRLYELAPHTGELRSFFQATERIVNAIACDEKTGHIFVPTVANEIYCIRKSGTPSFSTTP